MSFTPASLGFDLNNRELATLFYLGLLVIALLSWEKSRSPAIGVVRAFFAPRLVQLWLLMSLYVATCVWLLAFVRLWEWPNLKSTLVWWLTVGFTSVSEAMRLKEKQHMLPKLLSDAFKLSAVILFIVELVSFPPWVELIMLPALVFIGLLIAVGERQTDKPSVLRLVKVLNNLQVLAGVFIFTFSCWLVASRLADFWSLNTLREFGLPLLLWVMFIPFIFLLSVYLTYEDVLVRLQMRPKQAPIVHYARWQSLFAFGWNTDGLKRLARDMRERDIADKDGVRDAIKEIKRLRRVEKNPPIVMRSEGWSPYVARRFLEKYGLVTDDYHRTHWEWLAATSPVKLDDKMLADKISYGIAGNEGAATRLWIALDGSNQNDENEAQRAFDERVVALIAKAFNSTQAAEIYACAQVSAPEALVIDGIRISLNRTDWGDARFGGYSQRLTIQHSKHNDWPPFETR